MATTEAWREALYNARKAANLSQEELAAKVGSTQATISLIESGDYKSSKLVMPLCRVLGIAPPFQAVQGDLLTDWLEVGRLLVDDPEIMRAQIVALRLLAKRKK